MYLLKLLLVSLTIAFTNDDHLSSRPLTLPEKSEVDALMEVLLEKYRWIQRVLVDYIASKKAHVCHTTLDPQ